MRKNNTMQYEQAFDVANTPEINEKVHVSYLGKLEDFGLGNPNGIPSNLEEATPDVLEMYGERLIESTKEVSDYAHDGCIDGRTVIRNVDGSEPEVRERHVSGSASNLEIAFNSEAPITAKFTPETTLDEACEVVDAHVEKQSGKKRSAHTGGCGGANGSIEHNELIAIDPAILEATEAVMNLPVVHKVTGMRFDKKRGDAVRDRAARTAAWLKEKGWKGQDYVDMVQDKESAGVEDLHAIGGDFHGHKEDAIVIDTREGVVVTMDDVFVISMTAIRKKAEALAGRPGDESFIKRYNQALIADIAKHMAVAKVLPSEKTPVFVIG
jgi:hypothetical protein